MAKALRWAGYAVALVLILVASAALFIWASTARTLGAELEAKPERLVSAPQADAGLGDYLLVVRACAECHGEKLQGSKFLDIPNVVTLHAPNLTRLARQSTDQQLAQAIRQGIGRDGRPLLVMPSESYQFFTDAEVSALIKALRALPAAGGTTPPAQVGPLGRIGLATGKLKTGPALVAEFAAAQPASFGPEFAPGRHIAMTVCSGCHGPTLAGKEPEPGVIAPDLTMAGAYDLPAFTRLLRTGLPPSGRELKMMTNVSRKAFRGMTDAEIQQLLAYLQQRAKAAN